MADESAPSTSSEQARRLHAAVEPIAGSVYFAVDAHNAFTELGFDPPITADGCLPMPDLPAYFCSRAGCMGQVPGEVAVAAFGIFSPELIIPAVTRGWQTAGRDEVLAARDKGQRDLLHRVLGDPNDDTRRATQLLRRAAASASAGGRFLFAGLSSLATPEDDWCALWRAADLVREFRGDTHIAAWTSAGLDPVEVGLLTEFYYGIPSKLYHSSRGWTDDELNAGIGRLLIRGWIDGDGVGLTPAGRAVRESIEVATDEQQRPLLAALGGDLDELTELLAPWVAAILADGSYPTDVRQFPPQWGRLPALSR